MTPRPRIEPSLAGLGLRRRKAECTKGDHDDLRRTRKRIKKPTTSRKPPTNSENLAQVSLNARYKKRLARANRDSHLNRALFPRGMALKQRTKRKSMGKAQARQCHKPSLIYRPLNKERKEIRLLILEPGVGRGPVYGTLEHAFLSDDPKPRYETISYVWGDANLQANLYLNNSKLEVPSSAERVLRRMRLPHRTRTLWIDSACINQADIAERGHQVRIMDEIFANTYQNLIWLGEDDGYTASALETIDRIIVEIRRETDDYNMLGLMLYNGEIPLFSNRGFSFEFDEQPLQALFGSAWFSRLWIIQEACLPLRNACYRGDSELPFEDMLRVAVWLRYKSPFLKSRQDAYARAAYIFDLKDKSHGYFAVDKHQGLVNLLHGLRQFEARDAKDHIYGLLGLLKARLGAQRVSKLLLPDYGLSTAEVFQQAAQLLLQETGSLDLLHYVFRQSRTTDEDGSVFPSWLPRWDRPQQRTEGDREFLFAAYRADNDELPANLSIEFPQGRLSVTGIVVDKIETTKEYVESTKGYVAGGNSDMELFLQDVERLVAHGRTQDVLRTENQLGVILTAGNPRIQPQHPSELELERGIAYSAFKRWLKTKPRWPQRSEFPGPRDYTNDIASFFDDLCRTCRNRSIFRTASKFIGIGPYFSRPGDLVVVLYGCNHPVMLRPSAILPDEYEFLDVCHVHGIMDGEAVRIHRARGEKDTVFHLR